MPRPVPREECGLAPACASAPFVLFLAVFWTRPRESTRPEEYERAAIRAVDELGVVDIDRIGHGGHSYGAFATVSLLAHTPSYMYHGGDDNNPGMWPMQSERLMRPVTTLGKEAALFVYPFESHTPRAIEDNLDIWARWLDRFDTHAKGAVRHRGLEGPAPQPQGRLDTAASTKPATSRKYSVPATHGRSL